MSVARASVARMRAHDLPPASDAPRRYADGDTITHQGDRPTSAGRVVAGTARVAVLADGFGIGPELDAFYAAVLVRAASA